MSGIPKIQRRLDRRAFFEDLGYKPHEGQWLIHESTAPRRVVACGVRWGKTVCAAMEGLAAAMEPAERSVGWVCAPTYDLADRVFREMQLMIMEKLPHRVISMRESDRRILLRNLAGGRSEIRAKSADNPVSLLGEGLDWLIVDEASRLKPSIWQAHLSQRLIDKRGWALLISTPKGKGYFYDLWRRGAGDDEAYAAWNNPSWTNPMLDAALIESERSRLPERVFLQEFGAEFIEGAGAVFRNVREAARGTRKRPKPELIHYAGLDLARIEDYTVLIILNEHGRVVYWDRFHRVDWEIQVQRIAYLTQCYDVRSMWVDTTGKGEPVFERLRLAGCPAEPYTFTQRSKAALVNNLSMLLEKGALMLPRVDVWPELIEELEAFEYSVSEAGNVRTSAPSGMHDDCVVALALASWALRPRQERMFFIGTT